MIPNPNPKPELPYGVLMGYDLLPFDREAVQVYAKTVRAASGESYRAHAKSIGVSKSTLHRMETGGSLGWLAACKYLAATFAAPELWGEVFGLEMGANLRSAFIVDEYAA